MSDGYDESRRRGDMLTVWQLVGGMGFDGRLTLDETKLLTESLVVWASYVRNRGNKTWTARELGKSRRIIRSIVRRWEGTGGDMRILPISLRRWVLGAGNPSAVEASSSTHALQVDMEYELRLSRGKAVSGEDKWLLIGATPLALPAAITIGTRADDTNSIEDHLAVDPTEDGDPIPPPESGT